MPTPLAANDIEWAVYRLVVPWGEHIRVDGVEHDRFEWVALDEALRRCLPAVVADGLRLADESRRTGMEE